MRGFLFVGKPGLTDVQTLRQRARQHIEEGALTPGYGGDPATVVKLLNEALATELVCMLRYHRHYFISGRRSPATMGDAHSC